MKPKTYKHFKVKYLYNDTAYLETAIIFEFKKPITQREAKQICEKTYGTTDGFCVGMTLEHVIEHIKIGITLQEVIRFRGMFKNAYSYTATRKGSLYTHNQEWLKKSNENYVLGEDTINGIKINERIQQEELFEFEIRHRESFIEELIRWISEARSSDKELMKDDLQELMKVEDEYILSSVSTNNYLYKGCAEFENTCKELLELNKTL